MQKSVVVDVQSGAATTTAAASLTLSADRLLVKPGETVALGWASQGVYGCLASGAWSGQWQPNGYFRTPPIKVGSRYTLTCQTGKGSIDRSVLIGVTTSTPPKTTTATPKLTLGASSPAVKAGESVTLTWTGTAVNNCQASGSWTGSRATSGSETRTALTASQSYTLTCDSAAGKLVAMTSVQLWSGGVKVTWAPPRQNADGSPLTDLAAYRIYVGTLSRTYQQRFEVKDVSATQHFLSLLPGDYYVAMTAVDRDGNESAKSNEVLKVVQ